jgi:hypothetical protein
MLTGRRGRCRYGCRGGKALSRRIRARLSAHVSWIGLQGFKRWRLVHNLLLLFILFVVGLLFFFDTFD